MERANKDNTEMEDELKIDYNTENDSDRNRQVDGKKRDTQ